jgi:uncharacterized membrane protein YfhO
MVIKRINLNKIESFLKNISEKSTQIRMFQQEIENININLKDNKSDFTSGRISNEVYKDIKINLEKEKKILEDKINKIIGNFLVNSEKLQKIIDDNKI